MLPVNRTVQFLPLQSICLLFLNRALFHGVGPPVKCWIGVVRADILILFLILGGKHPVFHHIKDDVSCRLFCRCPLPVWGHSLLFPNCWISTKAFCASIKVNMWLLIHHINISRINWSNDTLDIFNLICLYFVRDFCVFVHERY